MKAQLEKAKFELGQKFQEGDYREASRLQYQVIPELEKKIREASLASKELHMDVLLLFFGNKEAPRNKPKRYYCTCYFGTRKW